MRAARIGYAAPRHGATRHAGRPEPSARRKALRVKDLGTRYVYTYRIDKQRRALPETYACLWVQCGCHDNKIRGG